MDVDESLACHYMRATRTPSILSYVEQTFKTLRSSLSTWVPQCDSVENTAGAAFSRDRNNASLTPTKGNMHAPEVIEDSALRVRGVIVDEIRFTSDTFHRSTTILKSLLELFRVIEATQFIKPYGDDCLKAFLGTICRNLAMDDSKVWHRHKEEFLEFFQRQKHSIDRFGSCDDAQLGGDLERFLSLIAELTNGMKLILTERGYIGMAPAVTHKRDRCAILCCSQHQCFLRAVEGPYTSNFHFLGPGYILRAQIRSRGGLGSEDSKDWLGWNGEEQDIHLC